MGQGPRYPSYEQPYDQNYPSYDDQFAEPVDLDAFGSQLRSGNPARSIATREQFLPDDSVPLFLANSEDDVRSPRFGRTRKSGSSRLLKTGAFVIAATIATFVAVKNPFTVFANATASLMGTSQDARSTPPAAPAGAPSNQTAAAAPSLAVVAAVPPAVPPTQAAPTTPPSRDEIASALRNAHQNVAPSEVQPPPPPPAVVAAVVPTVAAPTAVATVPAATSVAPPIRRLSPDEIANLMSRGKALLDSGDIAPARLLLERAAEAGEASAALMVAQTYDPGVLGAQDARNITSDPAQARNWYQRAAQLGSADAQRRLSQLQ